MGVEQAVKRFRALGQFSEAALLQCFCERIEQAPDIPILEGLMLRLAPFVKHERNESVAAHTDISRSDNKIVGIDVGDFCFLVGSNSFVLMVPLCEQEANGSADKLRKITNNVTGVFAAEFDLATERVG